MPPPHIFGEGWKGEKGAEKVNFVAYTFSVIASVYSRSCLGSFSILFEGLC